jgi:hypothetical protein
LPSNYPAISTKPSLSLNKQTTTYQTSIWYGKSSLPNGKIEGSIGSAKVSGTLSKNEIGVKASVSAFDSKIYNKTFNLGASVLHGDIEGSGKISKKGVSGSIGGEATVVSTNLSVSFNVFGVDVTIGGKASALTVGAKANLTAEKGNFKAGVYSGAGVVGLGFNIDIKW